MFLSIPSKCNKAQFQIQLHFAALNKNSYVRKEMSSKLREYFSVVLKTRGCKLSKTTCLLWSLNENLYCSNSGLN